MRSLPLFIENQSQGFSVGPMYQSYMLLGIQSLNMLSNNAVPRFYHIQAVP